MTTTKVDMIADYARLPRFRAPEGEWAFSVEVLRLLVVDEVSGQAMQRSDDCWFALLPFEDLIRSDGMAMVTRKVLPRRRFVILLSLLAALPGETEWGPSMRVTPRHTDHPGSTFWIDLLAKMQRSQHHLDMWNRTLLGLIAFRDAPRPRFLLCTAIDPQRMNYVAWLREFLFYDPQDRSEPSVFTKCGVAMPSTAQAYMVVEVGLSFSTGTLSLTMMTQLKELLQENEADASSHPIHLRVSTIRIAGDCVVQPKAMVVLAQLCESGLHLESVRLEGLADVKPTFSRQCLCALTSAQSQLVRLAVDSSDLLPAIASCVRYGCALQDLDIPFSSSPKFAAWLAFGLFHVDSESRIKRLVLRVGNSHEDVISTEWVDSFRRTLMSTKGTPLLLQVDGAAREGAVEFTERVFATVAQNTPIRERAGVSVPTSISLTSKTSYECIAQQGNWVAVVVPGVGLGWINAATIKSKTVCTSRLISDTATQTNKRITSFVVARSVVNRVTDQQRDHEETAVSDLLTIIGSSLTQLGLAHMRASNSLLDHILQQCPHIEDLNLHNNKIDDIAALLRAVDSGQSRIQSLSLHQEGLVHIYHQGQDAMLQQVIELVHVKKSRLRHLMGPLLPRTSTFRRFLPDSDYEGRRKSLQDAVNNSQSTSLEFVRIDHVHGTRDLGEYDLAPAFTSRTASRPMEMLVKLALISVVANTAVADQHQPLGQLDANVLSHIFQFVRQSNVARHVI